MAFVEAVDLGHCMFPVGIFGDIVVQEVIVKNALNDAIPLVLSFLRLRREKNLIRLFGRPSNVSELQSQPLCVVIHLQVLARQGL